MSRTCHWRQQCSVSRNARTQGGSSSMTPLRHEVASCSGMPGSLKIKLGFLPLLLLLLLHSFLNISLHGHCQLAARTGENPEVLALMEVKASLVDPQNVTSSWDGGYTEPCNWPHVTCSPNKSVITLQLARLQLSGTISPFVANLSHLHTLSLEGNNISGTIPDEIGWLSNLSFLDLSNNQFNGQIPASFGQLRNLQTLQLNRNNLSGPLPKSLSSLQGLVYGDFSFNNLSGVVPLLAACRYLAIEGNEYLSCGNGARGDCSARPPIVRNPSNSTLTGKRKTGLAVGTVAGVTAVVGGLGIIWRARKRCLKGNAEEEDVEELEMDRNRPQGKVGNLGQLKKYTFRELKQATGNFGSKNLLGSGGFGSVYKGTLADGSTVAVKRLRMKRGRSSASASSDVVSDSFRVEVEMISLAAHRNLLRLQGRCITRSGELLLVYPYMRHGSVASRFLDKPALDWRSRKRIAIGSAQALAYLHEQCDPKIIHRDVKAENILLDEGGEAIVADFGLAKFLEHSETHVITTGVKGTMGYIPPEYVLGQVSEKTDVYQFGILLLELITGKRASDFSAHRGLMLLEWVKKLALEERLEDLVDEEVRGVGYEVEELEELVKASLLCTRHAASDRPRMSEVLQMLEEAGGGEGGDLLAEARWQEACRCALLEPVRPQHYQAYSCRATEAASLPSLGPDSTDLNVMIAINNLDHHFSQPLHVQLSGPR